MRFHLFVALCLVELVMTTHAFFLAPLKWNHQKASALLSSSSGLFNQYNGDSIKVPATPQASNEEIKPKRPVYKHLFRHYPDISFDSWLRCAEPHPFLESVGYNREEIEQLSQDFPFLSLDVHDQLAAKVRFLVETMGGGTGQMAWKENDDERMAQPDEAEECVVVPDDNDNEFHARHSMRLLESTKQAVPANFFGCQLDRIVGPHHAYLMHHQLPHGQALLSDPKSFQLFLESSSLDDFCELCQEWESREGGVTTTTHTKEHIQNFERDFTAGLIPAAKRASPIIPLMVYHGANPFEYDAQGILPLHWAAGTGNLFGLQALFYAEKVDSIMDVIDNAREPKEGATPFHWACCGMSTEFIGEGGSFEICRWMLEQAGERRSELANQPTWTSQSTPVMWASWAGSISIVDLLVVHGADANVQNSRGETALHWAAAAGHLDVCQYLFDHLGGTSFLKQPDQSGRTPLDYAKLYQRKEVVDWLTETIYSKKMIKSSIWA